MAKKAKKKNSGKYNTLAVVGFVLAFVSTFIGLGLSIAGLVQLKKTGERGRGLAIAGIVISSVLTIAVPIILVFVLNTAMPKWRAIERNDARKADVAQVVDAVKQFKKDSGNALPTYGGQVYFYAKGVARNIEVVAYDDFKRGENEVGATINKIVVVTDARCVAENYGGYIAGVGTAAVIIALEDLKGRPQYHCLDTQ